MDDEIAIIGAGMAGLAAARRLAQAGLSVTLFDKSRGLGGRMATRRVESWQFDHGAQYFTARGDGFRSLSDGWLRDGVADDWAEGRLVGTPGMTAPARAMAQGHHVVTGFQVSRLSRTQHGWAIESKDGPAAAAANGRFAAVLLAIPACQAVPLLAGTGVSWPDLARVRFAPCWALMLAFGERVALTADRLRPQDEAIGWIARNGSKPGRAPEQETVVVHATAEWSRQNLEMTPDDAVAALLAQFRDITGVSASPLFAAAHRWRYALVEEPLGQPCLWDKEAGLGACGDWCLGPRVEAAFDSGEALAQQVVAARAAA